MVSEEMEEKLAKLGHAGPSWVKLGQAESSWAKLGQDNGKRGKRKKE